MVNSIHKALGEVARAYVSDRLHLDTRAGMAIGDEFWIAIAVQLVGGNARHLVKRTRHARTAPAARPASIS